MLSNNRKYLYRVLKRNENIEVGLRARAPNANTSVADHVGKGSDNPSQYISTSDTLSAARLFASKGWNQPKTIVKIDVEKLIQENPEITVIDLTNRAVLDYHIDKAEYRTRSCAIKYHEVLLLGFIPPSCISVVNWLTTDQNWLRLCFTFSAMKDIAKMCGLTKCFRNISYFW